MTRPNTQFLPDQGSTTLVTTAETVIGTFLGISVSGPGSRVLISSTVIVTPGTGTTAIQLRVRRGTTVAGAQVGSTVQFPVTAAVLNAGDISVVDSPGEVAGQAYVITAQQVAATANGTADDIGTLAVIE